jgi:phospholipase/carboxylesterase
MLGLAARINLPGIRWLAPAADTGKWYPNRFMEPLAANEPYLSRSIERCDRVVDEASEGGRLGPRQLVLAGFSQGACLAVEYALRHPGRCGALVVLSGCLIGPPGTEWKTSGETLRGTRALITGSDVDEWIPERWTRETARVLSELGADVELRVYPGRPHIVADQEIDEARSFLASFFEDAARDASTDRRAG